MWDAGKHFPPREKRRIAGIRAVFLLVTVGNLFHYTARPVNAGDASHRRMGVLLVQSRIETARSIQDLQTIERITQILSSNRDTDRDRSWKLLSVTSLDGMFERYSCELRWAVSETDPGKLEAKYREWAGTRMLEVVHRLILFNRMIESQRALVNTSTMGGMQQFVKEVFAVLQMTDMAMQVSADSNLRFLYAQLWRLRFVEPAGDAKDRIASTESKIKALEATIALDREVESVKAGLIQSIATGVGDAALEQRIAALPSDRRAEVEAVRTREQEAKQQQLAKALEAQQLQERALQRQRVIDEAIRLRREEIETGKVNPRTDEQRRSDPELRRAVDQWETAYRQEQAEKKGEEARRKLAEIERAKAEEERRRRAEALARQREEETARREAILRRYNVRASVLGDDLHVNPFRFEGEAVILTGVRFKRMIERSVAVFETFREKEVIVSGLPVHLFSQPGEMRDMIVRVRGKTAGTNLLGAAIEIPHVQYLDLSP